MIDRLVKNVLDVPGVEGLCLFDRSGRSLLGHLPPTTLPELVSEMLARAVSLYETIDDSFVPCDDYLFKYPSRWVHLRRSKELYLLAISTDSLNLVTFRMTTNLLLKNMPFNELRERAESTQQQQEPVAARPPTSAPPPPAAKPSSAPKPRTFRGRVY